eukprot:GHVO01036533.1.p1 GENE.GHVO01036533.1~~GHVO01036533.1.p1  ORF type:complete len:171 (+),score=24.58 GHVO01036533.1:105-617(+)
MSKHIWTDTELEETDLYFLETPLCEAAKRKAPGMVKAKAKPQPFRLLSRDNPRIHHAAPPPKKKVKEDEDAVAGPNPDEIVQKTSGRWIPTCNDLAMSIFRCCCCCGAPTNSGSLPTGPTIMAAPSASPPMAAPSASPPMAARSASPMAARSASPPMAAPDMDPPDDVDF